MSEEQSRTELLAKAAVTTEAMATAGSLNARQADAFLDFVILENDLTQRARVVRFRNKNYDIDEIGLGKRVAMAKKEALDPQKRRGVSHSKITLTPQDIVLPVEISHQYLRQNIQGMSVQDKIMAMMGRKLANDVEEFLIISNKLGPAQLTEDLFPGSGTGYIKDEYLALQDGWSLLSEQGHIFDAAGANISPTIFSEALQTLPTKYQRSFADLRFLAPNNINHKYNARISAREDSIGGNALSGGNAPSFGVARMNVPLWEMHPLTVEHVVFNAEVPVQLKCKPLQSVDSVFLDTLGSQLPSTPYIETTDYIIDLNTGLINRVATGAIPDGATVKVTYRPYPQMLLTDLRNLIVGFDTEDIRVLSGVEIFADKIQFAMHLRLACEIENKDAVVKVKNLGLG